MNNHGRLIDADALMETINSHCYPIRHDMTSIEPGMTRIGILQAIQEQPTIEPGPQWIPVSERLPEEKGRYLVCYTLGGTVRDIRTAMFYPGGWLEWDVDGIAGIALVRAWMPLPEPYREEDK